MPTIQISQLVLRSGPSIDLPGSPTSLSPLTFGPGLLPGEMAFMTDTGRIYIGHEPTEGQSSYNRLTFPYRNIEVLTEHSVDTIQKLIGSSSKEEGEFAFHIAALPTHTTDWENVIVPRVGDDTYAYRLPFSDSVSAVIEYATFDAGYKPIKMGVLSVRHFDGEAEPSVCDEATVKRRTDLLNPEVHQAEDVYGQLEFRFVVAGPVGGRYLAFQYKNRTTGVVSLRFKTSRSKV